MRSLYYFNVKRLNIRADVVVHTCNTSYMEGRDQRVVIQGSSGKTLVSTHLNKQVRHGGSHM
jgi:hypothetical protein